MSEPRARALPPEALRLHLPGLQPVRRPDRPAAAGDGGALGRGRLGPRRPPPGRRDADAAGPGQESAPSALRTVRRREAARGHRPGAHQGAGVLLRRRADQRPRLGARRTGDRAAAQRRPRARRDGADRGPRRPHHPLCGSRLQPGRRLPARERGRGPATGRTSTRTAATANSRPATRAFTDGDLPDEPVPSLVPAVAAAPPPVASGWSACWRFVGRPHGLGAVLARRRAVRVHRRVAGAGHSDLHYNFLGYADLEQGVTPLYPLQPGRVVKVFVHDGDHVDPDAPLFALDDQAGDGPDRRSRGRPE